jgi:hypothetical protein
MAGFFAHRAIRRRKPRVVSSVEASPNFTWGRRSGGRIFLLNRGRIARHAPENRGHRDHRSSENVPQIRGEQFAGTRGRLRRRAGAGVRVVRGIRHVARSGVSMLARFADMKGIESRGD